MKKEIEKRFLLKSLPIELFVEFQNKIEIQQIIQFYYLKDNIWSRIRRIESNAGGILYLHTTKTYIDNICYETEEYYDNVKYTKLINEITSGEYPSKILSKTRYTIITPIVADFEGELRNVKYEIDVFDKFSLIIAEIELPDLNFDFHLSDNLKKCIIYELTGIKEFSNINLAEPLKI